MSVTHQPRYTKINDFIPLSSAKELKNYAKIFSDEIEKGLNNKPSSLPLIINPISPQKPKPGFGVTIAVGGTNGYASSFHISKTGVIKFKNRQSFAVPPDTNQEKFLKLLAENGLAVANDRKTSFLIGIGLAYPLQPFRWEGLIGGKLLYVTKERQFHDLVGKNIGREFHNYLLKHYGLDCPISVANDSICLLLGGNGALLAGVVGTGLNFAYWEKSKNISSKKLAAMDPEYREATIAVNLEAANFNKIKPSLLLQDIDKTSDNPSKSLAEKEVAGVYLYKLFNAGLKRLGITSLSLLTATDQLNDIITHAYSFPTSASKEETEVARVLAERIFHRSAQIVAIEFCGILLKLGKTKGTVPVIMEGGIFWKAKNYPSLVNQYINTILPEVIPSFARLFGSSRRGIAILARST